MNENNHFFFIFFITTVFTRVFLPTLLIVPNNSRPTSPMMDTPTAITTTTTNGDQNNGVDNDDDSHDHQHQQQQQPLDFRLKTILAPMVRTGTLPMRLLALRFGADIVYTEELIDYKLLRCRRSVNTMIGTVDYIDDSGCIVFRTCPPKERHRLVLQLGTSDARRALRAAKLVARDVAAIDVNMGCPKEFSIKGGMGSALLGQPDKVGDILTTLVSNLPANLPVTCKMRVLPSLDDTIRLAKLIESCGVRALAVHGRTQQERPKDRNRDSYIQAIAQSIRIPVIASGGSADITCYEDIDRFRRQTTAASVMIARSAQKNCSIFRRPKADGDGGDLLDIEEVIRQYLRLCVDYDNHVLNIKYVIQQMLGPLQDSDRGRQLLAAQSLPTICRLWHLIEYYDDHQRHSRLKRESMSSKLLFNNEDNKLSTKVSVNKKLKTSADNVIISTDEDMDQTIIIHKMDVIFMRQLFVDQNSLPKSRLMSYTTSRSMDPPVYRTKQLDKHFHTVVTVGDGGDGKHYASRYLEKNKRYAEQMSALVAIIALNLIDDNTDDNDDDDYQKIINECLVLSNDFNNRITVEIDGQFTYE
ncbi:tRNA-dihydrouridine(20) synthase [NAD(P)+]-like [Oppia nitens]|uniref:tRNA-dihydrouridine(20) synthase [NAD(P)+]-like n=1 Tax=Oppia nitens TaxID=1686743 RepID=UPI0023DC6C8A|nr:tRNA-dihydrouridine(20) synthase [NAD(P)+]-like [Oppia nitens]